MTPLPDQAPASPTTDEQRPVTAASSRNPALTTPRPSLLLSRYAVVGVWALMTAVFTLAAPDTFGQIATFQNIFGSQQALVFLALGALCTFVAGEFDLSIASIMGMSATTVPVLVVLHGVSLGVAVLAAIGVAVLSGLVNGLLVVHLGVDAIIATLGTGTFLLGMASWISGQTTVGGLDVSYGDFVQQTLGGLPLSFYYGIVLAIAFGYVLTFTPLGRYLTFVGANAEVARLAGVNVNAIRIGSYVVGSLVAGVGGVLLVLSTGGYDSTSSPQYLLPTFAAAFLGTAVVRPGTFNPIGTMVAIYFLATGIVGLQILGLNGWIQNAFYGAALVVAVSIASVVRHRRSN
ncbi:sugar ABC transporter permease [Amycolatopsis deserti]|uniref:Autoinducer 2 import system permease protein LsrD n=1 Tax=Amycolatopsis deserti TaxID=185696 RepID=A0ABQ3JCS8_9PSEU|nr:ABC transporter permease [Amycolatopsis deserti]GHF19033.1 sugar ABC transporter permease [Amycolatopsis deserti]